MLHWNGGMVAAFEVNLFHLIASQQRNDEYRESVKEDRNPCSVVDHKHCAHRPVATPCLHCLQREQ